MSRGNTGAAGHPRYREYARAIAALLHKELKAAKLSPYAFAKRVGIHRAVLHYYLNAKNMPTPAMLVLFARTLGVPVSRLLPHRIRRRRKVAV